MKLSSDDLTILLEYAISAAKEAGALIESYADKAVTVEHKRGGDSLASQVVTEVDLLSEKIIVETLLPACEKFNIALLTEESEDDKARFEKDYFWCVDPMDGTLAFTESTAGYSVSISLVSQSGEAVIGVVYDPVSHTLYSTARGQHVSRNGKEWHVVVNSVVGKPLTLVCDRGFSEKPYYIDLCKALTLLAIEKGMSGLQVVERNGAVLNACYVLEHTPACYIKCPKPEQGGGSLWDFAATASLFFEMGAAVSDVYGKPLDLNRVESTYMNHRGVIFASNQLLSEDIQALLSAYCAI